MNGVNKVILIGNLGADPELKYTGAGTAVATLSLATNRKWTNKQGEPQEDTQWHRVVVWDKTAENCAEYLAKGRSVYVEGRLQTRQWDDSGVTRYTTEVVAQSVVFLGGGGESGKGKGNGGQRQGPPPVDDGDIPF